MIWTGSDDGLVQLTRDGGATWKNVTPKGLAECLINAIEVSPFDKATAYIATTRYKFNDHAPGLYKTTDYGATWTKIDKGIPGNAFTRVVREDNERRNLLFAGTERGVFISWNGGQDWSPFQLNLPVTPITDLRIHRGNLIAATSGRSFWILDDLTLIRQHKSDCSATSVLALQAGQCVSRQRRQRSERSGRGLHRRKRPSRRESRDRSRPLLPLPEMPKADAGPNLQLRLRKSRSRLRMPTENSCAPSRRRRIPTSRSGTADRRRRRCCPQKRAQPLRLGHALRDHSGCAWRVHRGSYNGHKAIPGKYRVSLKMGANKAETDVEILANPLYPTSAAAYREYHAVMSSMERDLTAMHTLVNSLNEKQKQLRRSWPRCRPATNTQA